MPSEETHDSQKGIDENIPRLEFDEAMEVEPSRFVDDRENTSIESSLVLQDTLSARPDQVPDLSGMVVKAEGAIFDGTYSTVYRGLYARHEVCFSVIDVVGVDLH